MKQSLSIVELAQKIEAQQNASKDFIADTREIEIEPNNEGEMLLSIGGNDPVAITDHFPEVG